MTLCHVSSEITKGPMLTDPVILRVAMPGGAVYIDCREMMSLELCNDAVLPDRHGYS